ncbi:MAG: RagB/SusD family nutrient uptake outer membrane protein [Bacteroidia bacterium]|nr:RagB/SusD family nutrient uptake outer membrane protein [Bacteroidia bacterium]
MKSIKIYIVVALSLFVFSCEDAIDLTPAQSLNTSEALTDVDGLRTALNGAYSSMQSVGYYGREYMVLPEIEGNLVYLSITNSNRFLSAYQYSWTVQNGDIADVWNICYRTILRVNNVINNIDEIEGDATDKNQIKGEALGIRALCYFDLVRFFAKPYTIGNPATDLGVPISLEATLEELPRNTVEEVYTQIISDINEAKSLMTSYDVGRFSVDAAEALLARVSLYKGDYAQAEASASTLMNAYALSSNYDAIFSGPGATSEDIFTLVFISTETNGADNHGNIYNPNGYGDIRVTEDLRNLYEAGDQRADQIYQHTDGEYYQSKYDEQDGIPGLVSPKILRVAEMYLIRAEARFNTGNKDGAVDDVNALRAARGASQISSLNLIRDILEERQRELVFEGHTTFDYFRNNVTMNRSQCNSGLEVEAPCSISTSDHRSVHPIPNDEILVNQSMVQNTGY